MHLQMLNPESGKYFTRVFAISGSALGSYAIYKNSQLEQVRECSNTSRIVDVINFVKTADSKVLLSCYPVNANRFRTVWLPTIESLLVVDAFMTTTPEEMYRTIQAPAMDSMFSITTQVYIY